jgi:hypothetical protein
MDCGKETLQGQEVVWWLTVKALLGAEGLRGDSQSSCKGVFWQDELWPSGTTTDQFLSSTFHVLWNVLGFPEDVGHYHSENLSCSKDKRTCSHRPIIQGSVWYERYKLITREPKGIPSWNCGCLNQIFFSKKAGTQGVKDNLVGNDSAEKWPM